MRKHEICSMCGQPIYHEDATHEQDVCYIINEDILCEDCVRDYLKENCKLVLGRE